MDELPFLARGEARAAAASQAAREELVHNPLRRPARTFDGGFRHLAAVLREKDAALGVRPKIIFSTAM